MGSTKGKILGIILSNDFTWIGDTIKVLGKCRCIMSTLWRVRNMIPEGEQRKLLAEGIIIS